MEGHDSAVWPVNQPYLRPIVMTGYFVAGCTLAAFIAKRTSTLSALRAMSVARLLTLAVFVDSFLFVFTSTILIFGIGTSYTDSSCALGIWWCIFLYATSKVAIYLFLMERVHLVFCHTAEGRVSRLKSPWYRVSLGFFALWIGVAIAMMVGRISYIREHDKSCIIGLKLYSTVLMLSVDLLVNVFLTLAFVWPIYKSQFTKARSLARNSCVAAVAALITSFANIALLTAQHGKQLSWVCLGSCGLDVTFNAVLIYIVTNGVRADQDLTARSAGSDTRNRRPSAYPTQNGTQGGTGTNVGANTFMADMSRSRHNADYDNEREMGQRSPFSSMARAPGAGGVSFPFPRGAPLSSPPFPTPPLAVVLRYSDKEKIGEYSDKDNLADRTEKDDRDSGESKRGPSSK